MNRLFLIFNLNFILFLASCSGVKMITPERKTAQDPQVVGVYTPEFLQKLNQVKEKLKQDKSDLALQELAQIKMENLNDPSVATIENLRGVIYFSQKKFDLASKHFEKAVSLSSIDLRLLSQVQFNLSSTFYKLNQHERAFQELQTINYRNLPGSEMKKYHQLVVILATQLGKKDEALVAGIRSFEDKRSVKEIRMDPKIEQIKKQYFSLSESQRVQILDTFNQEENLVVAELALKEAEESLRIGNLERFQSFTQWIEEHFETNSEIKELIKELSARSDEKNVVRIDLRNIGVILPLSGDLKGLGERVLQGLDVAMDELAPDVQKKYRLEIKDSKGSAATGAFYVKELIEEAQVSAIIGGLNSQEATKEYIEAKKAGVLFISLSKVLLPKEEKNHLLVEIPGSIESQISHLFSDKMMNRLGKRPAILYPKTEIGEAYANEFWRQAKKRELDVTGLISFDVAQTDFRDPVKNLLGIKFTREREEELALVSEIANLESKRRIKRIQNLQPQIDFDWLFVPALPREVVQILPNFNYFDAFNLNYVGVPSWRSELMLNEGYRYGQVHFIDEEMSQDETTFTKLFIYKFKKSPNIVETFSYDALKVLIGIIEADKTLQTRQDLDQVLLKQGSFKSESGSWKLEDDIWMKQMGTFKIKREGIETI